MLIFFHFKNITLKFKEVKGHHIRSKINKNIIKKKIKPITLKLLFKNRPIFLNYQKYGYNFNIYR